MNRMMNRKSVWCLPVLLAFIVCAEQTLAQDSAVISIDETVTGNQEQPKVLYIVPWKTAANNEDFEQSLAQKATGKVFRHIEREELQHELNYLQQKTAADAE